MMNSAHSPMEPQKSGMTRSIFRTLFMPEIKLSFGTTGMTHRAFLSILATMFIQAGLLPYNHPARSMETIGSTSFRSIMGEAWYNLRNSGKNDFHQYGLFFAVFLLIAMAIMMVMTFAGQLFVSTASAQIPGGLFSSPAPDTDIGLNLIEHLIGQASRGEGPPAVAALGQLFSIYSYGVLVIASFIVAWSVISIVVDTAATGKFFGGRHNPVWWPIRLVFGLALLVPLGHGFNAGQYMVIQIAKWGSNLASNAWYIYVEAVVTDGTQSYIARQYPTAEIFYDFKKIALIQLCKEGKNQLLEDKGRDALHPRWIIEYPLEGASGSKQVTATFGEQGGGLWRYDRASCGTVVLNRPNMDKDRELSVAAGAPTMRSSFNALANDIALAANENDRFFNIYQSTYNKSIELLETKAKTFVDYKMPSGDEFDRSEADFNTAMGTIVPLYDLYQDFFAEMNTAMEDVSAASNAEMRTVLGAIKQKGWPAAALWYYTISSSNQRIDEAVKASANIKVTGFDDNNEQLEELRTSFETWWNNEVGNLSIAISAVDEDSKAASDQMLRAQQPVEETSSTADDSDDSGGMILKALKKVFFPFGTPKDWISKGISKAKEMYAFEDIRSIYMNNIERAGFSDTTVHPIVLMTDIGNEMIAVAEMILAASIATSLLVAAVPLGTFGAVFAEIMGMLFVVVSPLIIGGVILSVILPMTPFIRFVFAISGWMIAIIEAVVMVPIIAIGHLRTDGEGILGPMLQGSYVMLLQLLLRPVLIVLGLILSMFLVEVTVSYVNSVYFQMLNSIPSGDRAGIGALSSLIKFVGHGVLYGVIMYGLINSSFKLVDILPEAVVKYLGGGPSGGVTDRDEGDINRAVLASAVFASNARMPNFGRKEKPRDDDPKDAAKKG